MSTKKKTEKKEVDPRDEISWLYKITNAEVIDRKVEQFVEKGVKFIRYACEIPSREFGAKSVKHDIVMTQEAFNKLSATQKKVIYGRKLNDRD